MRESLQPTPQEEKSTDMINTQRDIVEDKELRLPPERDVLNKIEAVYFYRY